jgi:hypothetical protein
MSNFFFARNLGTADEPATVLTLSVALAFAGMCLQNRCLAMRLYVTILLEPALKDKGGRTCIGFHCLRTETRVLGSCEQGNELAVIVPLLL